MRFVSSTPLVCSFGNGIVASGTMFSHSTRSGHYEMEALALSTGGRCCPNHTASMIVFAFLAANLVQVPEGCCLLLLICALVVRIM